MRPIHTCESGSLRLQGTIWFLCITWPPTILVTAGWTGILSPTKAVIWRLAKGLCGACRRPLPLEGFLSWIVTELVASVARWHSGKESTCQGRRLKFDLWVRKIPWRRKWQPALVFLPGESHGQRSLAGYRPRGYKELDMTEGLSEKAASVQGAGRVLTPS